MMQSSKPPANRFVAVARHLYNAVGFSKGYNAILFFIFAGALIGFTLARLQYLSFYGVFCNSTTPGAALGECYWYLMPRYRVGIILHLSCILPAAFLAVFQFVPAIRHRAILYHRIAGHIILALVFVGLIGMFMILRVSFGGTLETQAVMGTLGVVSIASLSLSYYNIKRKQIDQHRAWMLRSWFYMSSIITLRLIMFFAALVISTYSSGYYTVQSCKKLIFTAGNASQVYKAYPACAPKNANMTIDGQVVVPANINLTAETAMSSLNIGFGMAGMMALFLHAVGVEIYLLLTPREAERLRIASYHRQLEAGMKNPGSAGLVVESIGDADAWVPPVEAQRSVEKVSVVEETTKSPVVV